MTKYLFLVGIGMIGITLYGQTGLVLEPEVRLESTPKYNPDLYGIDSRIARFSQENKRLAFLYVEAFKELYAPLNLNITTNVTNEERPSRYARADHVFDDVKSRPVPMKEWWLVYINMFPMPDEVLNELSKIRTIRDLESMRMELLGTLGSESSSKGSTQEILLDIQKRIEKFPGNSRSKRLEYARELRRFRQEDVQALRRQLAIELRLGKALSRKDLYSVQTQAELHLWRIENGLAWKEKADFFLWTKVTPILEYLGLRYYYDALPDRLRRFRRVLSQHKGVRNTDQVSIRFYLTRREDFVAEFLEGELLVEMVKLARSVATFDRGINYKEEFLKRLWQSVSNFLIENNDTLPDTTVYGLNRGLETVKSVARQYSLNLNNPSKRAASIDPITFDEFFDANFEFYIEEGGSGSRKIVNESNYYRIHPISNNQPVFVGGEYLDQESSISLDYRPEKRSIRVSQTCGWSTMAWEKRLRSYSGVRELGPVECNGFGPRLYSFNGIMLLSAVVTQGSGVSRKFFDLVLGFKDPNAFRGVHPDKLWKCKRTLVGGMSGEGYGSTKEAAIRAAMKAMGFSSSNATEVECNKRTLTP